MLPFHSKKKTRDIRPPHDILENYVWAPLREMETEVIFAFGSDWVPVCASLLGAPVASYGPNPGQQALRDTTKGNWQVNIHMLRNKLLVVSWQKGYSPDPPGEKRISEFRRVVNEILSIP